VKLLGPNQAKVIVETSMDFTKTEKVEYEKEKEGDKNPFKVQGQAGDVSGIEYLMPGFGIPKSGGGDSPKSYTKQMAFPSVFIKKIKVTILVNKNLDEPSLLNIREVAKEVLSINEARGDEIVLIKAFFAPLWKTIWYNPESMNFVVKYIILSILAIISLIIVAVGFLKLAGAMNTMAKVQQSHNITMEMGNPIPGKDGYPGGANISLSSFPADKERNETGKAAETDEGIYFDIKLHQIDALVALMINEDPLNVSIMVSHLKKDIKELFFSKLPPEFASEIISGLTKIRFIENDTILILKDELETRLSGAIGGLKNVLETFENLTPLKKMEMIKTIEKKHPETAAELRKHMIIFDDISFLEEKELSLLVSACENADWAVLYYEMDEELKVKIRAQMSETSWEIIKEKNKYEQASREKIEKAMKNILGKTEELIYEGRIKKPNPRLTSNLIENKKMEIKTE